MSNLDRGDVMTVREVGELLNLRRATVCQLVKSGQLPGFHPTGSRQWRFLRADVEALFLPQKKVNQGPPNPARIPNTNR